MLNTLLLSFKENCTEMATVFISSLKVKVTTATLEKELTDHPDYPSLLSISDVLNRYGVENISIRTSISNFPELPVPFMVQIKGEATTSDFFSVIRSVNGDMIEYFDPEKHQWKRSAKTDFEKRWQSGVALLADAEEAVGEKNYRELHRKEVRSKAILWVLAMVIPAALLISTVLAFIQSGTAALLPVLFTWSMLAGIAMSTLLLWYELDQYNPLLQQICGIGKKVNCSAVLHSSLSKIAGISWSVIGFTYFTGSFLVMLMAGPGTQNILFQQACLSLAATPYIFFSIYYQRFVVKQWCLLCLGTQLLLAMQLTIVLTGGWLALSNNFSSGAMADTIIRSAPAYLVPFIIAYASSPLYKIFKDGKYQKRALQRLKYAPDIFASLLKSQKSITEPIDGLGITLGDPNAKNILIKVCAPYCGPCAKAHPAIEELLHNNPDLQLKIIFLATNSEEDKRMYPVRHLLAIAEKGNEELTKHALNDWYMEEKKDYKTFAAKYPMNGELNAQGNKIEGMQQWCEKTGIAFTPTFFLNGYQLPEMYKVPDLKYFLLA